MKVRGLERLEGCRVERLEGQRVEWLEGQGVEWLEGQGVEWLEGQGVERLEGQRMERLEGQRMERLEGVIVGDFGSTPNIIRPSKPKPYGSLYLPPFLPYNFHTTVTTFQQNIQPCFFVNSHTFHGHGSNPCNLKYQKWMPMESVLRVSRYGLGSSEMCITKGMEIS